MSAFFSALAVSSCLEISLFATEQILHKNPPNCPAALKVRKNICVCRAGKKVTVLKWPGKSCKGSKKIKFAHPYSPIHHFGKQGHRRMFNSMIRHFPSHLIELNKRWGLNCIGVFFFSVAHRPFKVTSVRPYYDMSVGWDR